MQYYSSAVKARSILDPDVVRHIEKCFTKKGMKEMKAGRKKRAYPKRKEIIKIPSDYYKIKEEAPEDITEPEYDATAEEDNEEDVDEVDEVPEDVVPDEYVPTESEMRSQLEEEIFGEVEFGEIVRKKKAVRSGVSDRVGRGGRNEDAKKHLPDKVVLGAVGYMLDNDNKGKEGSINLNSLFKKRGRRKKKRTDFDAFSDEDEYTLPNNLCMKNTGVDGSRKSKRITMRRESGDSNTGPEPAETDVSEKEPRAEQAKVKVTTVPPVSAESDQDQAREEKLEEIRDIVVAKLAPESVPSPAPVPQAAFTEPSSSSEDEQSKKEKKLKRGRGGQAAKEDGDASQEEIEEMIRCVSRASRPSSQASDRPESQQSRPSSALPKKYARHLDGLGSPDRDSPVLAPRQRQKEAKDKQLEAVKQKLYSPRALTPVQARSPVQHDIVSENYLKKQELSLSVNSEAKPALGIFEQAYARKGQASKIKKLMEKQKKKAEKMQNKKYQGFGDKKDDAEEEKIKREKKEQKKREQTLKKAQVSRQEADLMKELLMIGVTAVEESTPSSPSQLPSTSKVIQTQSIEVTRTKSHDAEAIKHFEESQTIDDDPQQNLSEELDKLFELN